MSPSPLEVPRELARRFDARAVKRQAVAMVNRLEANHPGLVAELRQDPLATLEAFAEVAFRVDGGTVGGGCSVLGSYSTNHNPPQITVTNTGNVPQMRYSALHELGHHEQQGDLEWGLAALMQADRDRARRLEEQVCEAFAAQVLLGDDVVLEVIGDGVPTASAIADLHAHTGASRSASAVAVVQLLRADGLVMVATADDRALFFAAAAGDIIVPKRGTVQAADSVVARAATAGSARSRDDSVMYGTGRTLDGFAADAVRDGEYVYAVFTSGRPGWVSGAYAPGRLRWGSKDVHCPCGSTFESGSGSGCDMCGRYDRCSDCGRCVCQGEKQRTKTCTECNLEWPLGRFAVGSPFCNDCA